MPPEEPGLSINDVVGLLDKQYAIITGGKTPEGYPLITLPDLNDFSDLNDCDYQKIMLYLTSVPSMQEADLGFAIIVDRRNDKWSSVKSTLLKISGYFPGLIHVVYVIRPSALIQRAISEVSNKFFKEEFKFKVVVCGGVEELHRYIDPKELTTDMDGKITYSHLHWIQQRTELEEFSKQMHSVSKSLDTFTCRLRGSIENLSSADVGTNDYPDTDRIGNLLTTQLIEYTRLKEDILQAAGRGEDLLTSVKARLAENNKQEPSSLVNITAVERLLVQLEETERTFDDFWREHSARLRQYTDLQQFYADFRTIQNKMSLHLKLVSQSTEIGETVQRVEYLIKEFRVFEKMCCEDLEQCETLISQGRTLVQGKHYWPLESVEVRCDEIERMCSTLRDRLEFRSDTLVKCHKLQITVEKANKWCARGIELLGTSHIEKCACALEAAEQSLSELEPFTSGAEQFNALLIEYSTPETKALVTQVLQRIDDVKTMCNKRITTLKRLVEKPPRPVQTVNPEPRVMPTLAPNYVQLPSSKSPASFKEEDEEENNIYNLAEDDNSSTSSVEREQEIKRGHILTELLETERVYVTELGSIIKGYKHALNHEETKHLVTSDLEDKGDILFGNLEEIFNFHGEIFLQDLENCISTTELVALCFTHRRDSFHKLYSSYCQNIPRSERLRESLGDHPFFKTCQLKLGHKLPLAAYLLKPVQRITKYQLLLKDLLGQSEGQKWCCELQEALDCMREVVKCVNDSMHQTAITGYWGDLSDLGDLLMQSSFSVWTENKKDRLRDLRLKPMQRHIFLYQKAMLFCKKTASHNKATYLFKRLLKMSEIGLTETVRLDGRTFEVWLTGRSEVHTIQSTSPEIKTQWVEQIKSLLLYQLTQLKIKQTSGRPTHTNLRQTMSLDSGNPKAGPRTMSCDGEARAKPPSDEDAASSSDNMSNSEDEETFSTQSSKYTALADYSALGHSELTMKEGDKVSLLKVGCAGWWYVRHLGTLDGARRDGWVPAAYLEHCGRKSSKSSQSVNSQASSNND